MSLEDHGPWAGASAGRLRELQSSSAHLPAEKRRAYLREELRACVAELPESERVARLEALAEHFPAEAASPAAPGAAATSPEQALAVLERALEQADEAAREALAAQLRALLNRIAPTPAKAGGGDLVGLLHYEPDQIPHLQLALTVLKSGKLEINSPAALELLNVVKSAALFIDTFSGVEAVLWKIWSAAAPKSNLRDPFGDGFLAETARLLEGRPGASFAVYSRSVTDSGRLIVALLSALPTALDRTARGWLDRFAPERIAADVRRTERSTLGGQPESQFWREYEYRCADFTPPKLAEEFFRHLSESAASMVGAGVST